MNKLFQLSRKCSRNFVKVAVLTAFASMTCGSSGTATATCEQVHPFPPESIFFYDVNNSALQNGIGVGAAAGIDQGKNADCWFESALAAVARFPQGARLISEMIAAAPGGYEVTFQDQPQRHFHVTQAEITTLHLKDKATWADVLEAAGVKRFPAVTQGDA